MVCACSCIFVIDNPCPPWPILANFGHPWPFLAIITLLWFTVNVPVSFWCWALVKRWASKRGGSLNRLWYSCFLVFNYLIFEGFCQITNIFHRLREILRSREYREVASLKSPTMLQWIYAYFVQFFELWHWTKLEIRSFFGSVCTEVIPVFCPTCRVIVLKHHVH